MFMSVIVFLVMLEITAFGVCRLHGTEKTPGCSSKTEILLNY